MADAGNKTVEHPAEPRISFERLGGFSPLYRAYCNDFEAVADYYARDWRSPEALAAAAQEAAERPRDRETLVRVLREQQERWGGEPEALAQVERLLDPESAVVVTGQQVGLFTGPLYTVLKALTTLQLAAKLEADTGRPVVPVFWLGSEDHDFEEMAGVGIPGGEGCADCRYAGHTLPEDGNLGPVGRLTFTDDLERVLSRVGELLPPSDFHDDLMARVREAYHPGTTFQDAFAHLMRTLLPSQGLVLMSADHADLKALVKPLYRREIEDWSTIADGIQAVSAELEQKYHAQVHIRPTNLFLFEDGQRLPLDADGDRFVLRGTSKSFTRDELLALLDSEPERFSPNVVLRPLTQDWLLPTAAYVGGPGETAYFAQYRPAYEWAELPMPVIYPRVSVSIVEGRIRKSLDRLGHPIEDYSGDIEALFSRVVTEELDYDLDAVFGRATGEIHKAISGLKGTVTDVDRSLGKTVEATRAAMAKELDALKHRVVRSERRSHDEMKAQIMKVRNALFPNGVAQERIISPLFFLDKYGLDFFVRLRDRLPVETGDHIVIDL